MPQVVRFQTSHAEPYPLQVQGESYYKENIEDVTNYAGEDAGVDIDDLIAQIILDDDNQYDPGNAVKVTIGDKQVGHLAKPDAKQYRQKLADLGIPDAIGECYASVKGGFIKRDGSQADFGIRLDLIISEMAIQPPPASKQPIAPAAPMPKVPPPTAAPIAEEPSWKIALRKTGQFLAWAFAPNRWWKTLLVLFFGPPFVCGLLQGIMQAIVDAIRP
jgi:hypothetical protein